jgi:hypothetical protein
VNGDTVSWTFKDGWSLIRFIQAFTASDSSNLTSAQPFVLTFNIPEAPANASSAKLQTQAFLTARVFIRLLISPPGAKDSITNASFPVLAPPLPRLRSEQAKGR